MKTKNKQRDKLNFNRTLTPRKRITGHKFVLKKTDRKSLYKNNRNTLKRARRHQIKLHMADYLNYIFFCVIALILIYFLATIILDYYEI